MAEKQTEKTPKGPKRPTRRNPSMAGLQKYGTPIGIGFLDAALEAKLGFYGGLAPEARAIVLGGLGAFALKKGKTELGNALLTLAGRYAGQRIFRAAAAPAADGEPSVGELQDAADEELEDTAARYALSDVEDDDLGAIPDLGALPDDELGDSDYYDDAA